MPVYKLTLEYDGHPFSGWQTAEGRPTVQGTLTAALQTVLRSPHSLQGASRTDAGVHAIGQVASFRSDIDIAPRRLVRGLSALCAPHIAVVHAEVMPDAFHARFDATGKHYRYVLLHRSAPSPLYGHTCWQVPSLLNLDRLTEAAATFVGVHDFAGFRASDCGRINTVREITSVDIRFPGNDQIECHIRGTAFLKYMVRTMVGTLVDIARGVRPPDTVERVFESRKREMAGITAPAGGLTLMEVYYGKDFHRTGEPS